MFETFAVFLHALRQVARRQMAQALHQPIGQVVWQQRQLVEAGVHTAFQGEEARHLIGAELVDHHEGVFAVHLGDVEDIAVHVLTGHRQVFELAQHVAAQFGQHRGVVGADIEHLLFAFFLEGVEPHREHRQLAGAAGGLVQAAFVGVEAGRVSASTSRTRLAYSLSEARSSPYSTSVGR